MITRNNKFDLSLRPLRLCGEKNSAFFRMTAVIFAALLLLGAMVRIYGAWQMRHNLNPDAGVAALMARHMAEGKDFPVFFYGQAYMGSLEPLVSAIFCALFGTSGFMVTLGTAFVGWLILLTVFVWARDAHSPAAGLAAMAYCIIGPSGFTHYQVSPRGGYTVTILLSTLILWLISKLIGESIATDRNLPPVVDRKVGPDCQSGPPASLCEALRAGRPNDKNAAGQGCPALPQTVDSRPSIVDCQKAVASGPRRPNLSSKGGWFILGLLAGLGWWTNQLIVGAIFAAAVMALLFLRRKVFSFNTLAAAIGFFAGSLPFWWWNFFNGWQSFEFAGSFGQTSFVRGLNIFFIERLPDLLDLNQGPIIWRIILGISFIGAAVWAFLMMRRAIKEKQNNRWVHLLTPFVFVLVSVLLFSTSHFALMNTPRHLLPLVPVMAVVFGVMTAELARRKYFFAGVIPLAVVIAGQAANLSWLPARGRGEAAYQRQIEECGRFLQSQQINACYAPYGKHSWNFALREEICFCDLPQDRYLPYVRRAELADRVAVFDNLGDINNFVANYRGSARTTYSETTPICWDFTPPREGLAAIPPDAIASIRDSLEHDILTEITDGNIDTGWEGALPEGDDEWLEIAFKTPPTVRMIRLIYKEYPEAWQITGQGDDAAWKTLTPCIQTAGYLWSGPRPYWSFGLEGYRLECRLPPEKLKRLRIHRIQSGYKLLEMQLFGPAVAPESEEAALKSLLELIRQRNLKRLYCDRWPANAVFRETRGAVQTWLNPHVFGECSLANNNTLWFTPRTGLLVREEDAPLCRQTLAGRLIEMRSTKIGPWVLFDFEPGEWEAEYGRDFELSWAGFACLAKNNKRWAVELVNRADLYQSAGKKSETIFLLQKSCVAWPLYPPAVERLAKITAAQGWITDAGYWESEAEKTQPGIRADIKFSNGIEFAGLALSTNKVSAGDSLTARYFWKYPTNELAGKPWVFVHFLHGENILQDDHPLGKFKGLEYQPFYELFVETRTLIVPKTAPEGEYQVRIGLYDASRADQKRFKVKTELPSRLNSVELPVKLTVWKKKSPLR